MSRTVKGSKGAGYEYWTARPGNKHGSYSLGKAMKRKTHKAERRERERETLDRLKE